MRNLERRKNKRNLVTLAINDVHQLQSWYMPFITNGGLFLQGNHDYQLGDQFFLLLDLLDEIEQIPVAVQVIWVAANGVKNPHKPGVGVQFTDADNVWRRTKSKRTWRARRELSGPLRRCNEH